MAHQFLDSSNDQRQTPLYLCLRRVHGRPVAAQPVPVPVEGVVIGGEGGPMGMDASLHVGARHALVRAARPGETDGWRIEPGNTAMVLAVNDCRVLWGESVALHNGDKVEVGFALLTVETAACAGFESNDKISRAQATLFVPRSPSETLRLESTDSFSTSVNASRSISVPPEEDSASVELSVETPKGMESEARLLADMLTAPFGEAVEAGDSGGLCAALPLGKEVFAAITREAEPPEQASAPDDILAVLAAESERAVACGGQLPPDTRTDAALPVPCGTDSGLSVDPVAHLFQRHTGASSTPATTTSMEEILEGPLTIDDVLERLRRQTPTGDGSPFFETRKPAGTDNLLDEVARVPDPLLLLAGMETAPVREPELAPVLRREHRATGMKTPYRFVTSGTESRGGDVDNRDE